MSLMHVTTPGTGHTTLAWKPADAETELVAPPDAEVVSEEEAREVFTRLMEFGALFDTSVQGQPVQVREFPVKEAELTYVPQVQGG